MLLLKLLLLSSVKIFNNWVPTLRLGVTYRVATDLENPENLLSQGILKRPLKLRELATESQKSGKSQGILLSEIHFQPC